MIKDIAREVEKLADELGIDRKRSIGEVAKELDLEPYIIRFWEKKFPQIQPQLGNGSRRYYYNKQLRILRKIKKFLYEDGYTISGLQKMLKRRKQDKYQEEDLDIILENYEKEGRNLEDFIDNNLVKITEENLPENKDLIDSQSRIKLMEFANIQIPAIDPIRKKELLELVKNIKTNLKKLPT